MIPQEGKVLIKFSASWCGPCKMLSKIMEGVDIPIPVVEVDIDNNTELATMFKIRGVPTIIIYEDGKEIIRKSGILQASEIQKLFEDNE